MVVDTSVLIAVLFKEKHADWAARKMNESTGSLVMSTVNLTEALILIRDRQPRMYDEIEARILSSSIRFVPPDTDQARTAATARLEHPLNLGDCFAYALARAEGCAILTLDRDFEVLDHEVILP